MIVSLSTIDLIQLRKLILGVDLSFQFNESWRFVSSSFVFPDLNNPWKTVFPEEVSFNPIDGHKRADFIGIKVGDVNGSAQINGPVTPGIRNDEVTGQWNLNIENGVVEAGEIVEIPILLKNTKGVEGFQFALQFDENIFDCNINNDNITDLYNKIIKSGLKNKWLNTSSSTSSGLCFLVCVCVCVYVCVSE
jgi:hypothetical protein